MTSKWWVIGVPTSPTDGMQPLADAAGAGSRSLASVFRVQPLRGEEYLKLPVGTLDALLRLSEEMERVDTFVEGVVRRLERQIAETNSAASSASAAAAGGSAQRVPLQVGQVTVEKWLEQFHWDERRWDPRENLPQKVKRLRDAADAVDRDIRRYVVAYSEKRQAMAALERRKQGNLLTIGLEGIVTPDTLQDAGAEVILDSEFLETVFIVVPKRAKEQFLEEYENLDPDSVPVGDADDREAVRAPPAVPGSARVIHEDAEGYCLFTVVILKKFRDSFVEACKKHKFTVRNFKYDPSSATSAADKGARLEAAVAASLQELRQRAVRQYDEAFSIWTHLKVVRVYVESVLRYGIPPEYHIVFMRINSGAEQRLKKALQKGFQSLAEDGLFEDEGDDWGDAPGGAMMAAGGGGASIPGVPLVAVEMEVRTQA